MSVKERHLQRNKVRQALDIFDIIQSVGSERLVCEIQAKVQAKLIPIRIEVNTSGEESKCGVPVDSTIGFLRNISSFVNVQGLMTIAPLLDDPEKAGPYFVKLKEPKAGANRSNLPKIGMKYLSMGMTDDFEAAVQEGSNMARIGRVIFGERR